MIKTLTLLTTAALIVAPSHAALIGWQAEDGASNSGTVTASLGADFDPPVTGGVSGALGDSYLTIETNGGGQTPGSAARVATYQISFDETGTYDLYARLFYDTAGNDSMFYARDFGNADPTNDGTPIGWAHMNDLPSADFNQWVWINLSERPQATLGEPGNSLVVTDASSPLTFQIGGREDGLLIDAFAFGTADQTFTTAQLDASVVIPEPGSLALLGLGGLLIARRRRA